MVTAQVEMSPQAYLLNLLKHTSQVYLQAYLEAGESPVVGCPQLLVQHIHACKPHPWSGSYIRSPKSHHALLSRATAQQHGGLL
jgi:hypothetical protein